MKKILLLFALLTASVVAFGQGPSTPITYPVSDPTGVVCTSTFALYQGRLFVCVANHYLLMPTVSNSLTGFVNYPFTSPAGALCTKNGTQDPPIEVFNGVVFSCQSSAYTAVGGGGGSGTPGGTNGQIQYNNGGLFGGFTASGDITVVTSTGVVTLATVNAGPGACGDATHVCAVTTDGKGRVLSQTSTAISGAGASPGGSNDAVQYNAGSGSFGGLNSPTTNGNCAVSFNVTGSAAVPPTCSVPGVTVTANSGNYSLLYSDRVAYMKFSGGTTATLTLCQITGTCANNFPFVVQNLNSGTLTITANAADKIDNGSTGGSVTIPANTAAFVYQDSSSAPGNWWSIKLANSALAIKSGDAAGGSLAGTYPNPTLSTVASSGTCGDTTHSCTVTITTEGRVTAITNNVISSSSSALPLFSSGPQTAITGTGASAIVYSFVIPGGSLASTTACLRATVGFKHTTGSASVTYSWGFGGGAISGFASTSSAVGSDQLNVCNNGATGQQFYLRTNGFAGATGFAPTQAITNQDSTNNITISFNFTVAATDAVTPEFFSLELY